MPQTASQRISKTVAAPQPVADQDPAETPDHEFALVSVLYHALQGVQACEQYIQDAQKSGDPELVTFFQECVEEQQQRAARAKELIINTVDEDDDEDDDDDDDDDK